MQAQTIPARRDDGRSLYLQYVLAIAVALVGNLLGFAFTVYVPLAALTLLSARRYR